MHIFNGVTFKVVRKNNELVIESNIRNLDTFEKDLFMKFFNEGTLNIKGKEYTIVNGEIFQVGDDGEIYKNKEYIRSYNV